MKLLKLILKEGNVALPGSLAVPGDCKGIVLFAHGSGSSRFSPRNRQVAEALNGQGLGTLLFDLLTEPESQDRSRVFDIPLLAERLELATRWILRQPEFQGMPIGYFGASTGGGAALWAAADLKERIAAVVSRGGRPDLAIPRLREVTAQTLLIVGGDDEVVIDLNQEAMRFLKYGRLELVPGATHLFEEPGALEQVAKLAGDWFVRCFERAEERRAA